jgi:hypothetical protein
MTAVNYLPGSTQWLGLAKEVTPGTPIAAPTMWIPVISPKYSRKTTPLKDQALRGTMATTYGQVQGMAWAELSYQTQVYADTAYPHFLSILGGTDTVTGSTDPIMHACSLYNLSDATHTAQPTSYTGFLYQGDGKVMQIPGMVASDVKLTIKANEKPTIDVAWTGLQGINLAAPTNTPTTAQLMPPFTASISLGGSAALKYTNITIDIKRDVKPVPVINGTQVPGGIFGGPVTVTGTFDSVYQGTADVDLANFIANTQPSVVVSLFTQGDSTHPLKLQMSKVAYDAADPQPTATDWLTIQSTFEAIANATDALDTKFSPIQAQQINAVITPF